MNVILLFSSQFLQNKGLNITIYLHFRATPPPFLPAPRPAMILAPSQGLR